MDIRTALTTIGREEEVSTTNVGHRTTTPNQENTTSRKRAPGAPSTSDVPSSSDPTKKARKRMELIITPRTRACELQFGKKGYYPVKEGEVLQNRYELQDMLGSGTFGTAHRGIDRKTNRCVALKISRSGKEWNDASKREIEFLKIAKEKSEQSPHSASPLGSNNIVSLVDDFKLNGPHGQHDVMVMELLGPDLFSILFYSNQKVLTLHRIKSFSRNILEGLRFLHLKCEIMHLDLKPDNFFVTVDPDNMDLSDPNCKARLKIGDFSTSARTDRVLYDTVQVCSYRAPESFLRARIGPGTDIWSVGCIIFEMVTRQLLFPYVNEDRDHRWHLRNIAALLGPVMMDYFEKNTQNMDVFEAVFGSQTVLMERPLDIDRISPRELMRSNSMEQSDAEKLNKLLRKLMKIDPKKRPTALQALAYPFLKD